MWSIKRTCFTIEWFGLIFLVQQVLPQFLTSPFYPSRVLRLNPSPLALPTSNRSKHKTVAPKVYLLGLLRCKILFKYHSTCKRKREHHQSVKVPVPLQPNHRTGIRDTSGHTRDNLLGTQFTLMSCNNFKEKVIWGPNRRHMTTAVAYGNITWA